MSKIGLIIGREYSSRVKKRSFIVMTILVPILAAGFLIGAMILGMPEDKNFKIIVVDEAGVATYNLFEKQYISQNQEKSEGTLITDPDADLVEKYKFVYYDNVEEGISYEDVKDLFKEDEKLKDFDLLLYVPSEINAPTSKLYNSAKIIYREIPPGYVQTKISQLLNESVELMKMENFDIDPNVYQSIKTKIRVDFNDVESESNGDSFISIKAGIGFAFGLMIYLFIFVYGVQVMKGVIEEKTNRIVEVIISSVKPFELMMGKIVGIMLVGLTQFAMWVLLIGLFSTLIMPFMLPDQYSAAFQATGGAGMQQTEEVMALANTSQLTIQDNEMIDFLFNEVPWGSIIFIFLFFFIGGYLLYGSLMAAIGAAVDSETDTQQFMLPVTMPLMFAYIIAIMGMQDPNSTVMQWCSQIPFTSPVVMLVRYSANGGDDMLGQLILSMALLIIAFVATTWLAGKIYRTGILMYGKKVSYKELFKWLKY